MLFSPVFLLLFNTLSVNNNFISCDFVTDSNISLTQYVHTAASEDGDFIDTIFNYNFSFNGVITTNENGLYSLYFDTLYVDFKEIYYEPFSDVDIIDGESFDISLDFYYFPDQQSNLYFDFGSHISSYDYLDVDTINFTFDFGSSDVDYSLEYVTLKDFRCVGDSSLYTFCNYDVYDIYFGGSFGAIYEFNLMPTDSVVQGLRNITLESATSYSLGYNDGYNVGNQNGYNTGYTDGYNVGNQTGYNTGYTAGYNVGNQTGYNNGYNTGYTDGYNNGASQDELAFTIFNGILNVALVPINFFLSIFNFEILGINIKSLVSALLTLAIIIIVIRLITGKKE